MFALSAMSYIDRTAMSIAAPTIIREFRLSETEMGTVFSAFILSYAVLMAPGGRLADRLGARLVLGLVSTGASLFTFLTAAVGRIPFPALPSLLGIRLGLGACTSPLYPACARMTFRWLPVSQHARTQGFILSGAAVGSAITPILFARLIALYGWRVSFALAGVATALLGLVWFYAARDRPTGTATAPGVRDGGGSLSWRPLFTNRNLALLTLGYFTLNYFEYIFFYWIYYYFGEIRKAGAERSAVYTTIMLLTMAAMMPLGGWVSDRLTPRWGARTARRNVALAGMILSAVLLYIGTSLDRPLPVVALLSLALGFCVTAEGPFWASAIEAGGVQSGSATGIMNGIGNLGGLLAPVLTPFIAQRAGWSWGLYAASLFVLAGAISWLFTVDSIQEESR
jgi:ACS family glucarate transporter-like MFS transporter